MHKYHWLQLFAEGAAAPAGDGAAETGDIAPDAGEHILTGLGVPADKISKRSKQRVGAMARETAKPADHVTAQPDDAAGKDTTEATEAKKPTWDEIMADPEYNQKMQETISKRLKAEKSAKETLDSLQPALELLSRKYGFTGENSDYAALSDAISKDAQFYETRAEELGVPVEQAMQIDRLERENARLRERERISVEDQKMQSHFVNLVQQGEELKKTFPSFDLRAELQNPVFARMTAPDVGIPVAQAYRAVHSDEIQAVSMQVAAHKTREQISQNIQSGMNRPTENGASAAASVSTTTNKGMTREYRAEIKRRMAEASARGEKLYPGQF